MAMAEGENEKKKRSALPIIAALLVVVLGLAAVIWLTRPKAEDPATAPPPEMGPDTAEARPVDPASLPPVAAQPDLAQAASLAAPPAPASAAITFKDDTLSFSAVVPEGPPGDPVLAHLRQDAQNYLAKTRTSARAEFERRKKVGATPLPWEVDIKWAYTAKADGIVSLTGVASEFTGGAHPNLMYDTLIARATGEKLTMNDMFILKRSPSPAMTIAICEALKAAKTGKIKSATIFDEPIVCAGPDANAKTETSKIALAPSSQPDRFGGVYAYYDPYAVGAWVEGPYILTVQQEVFAEDLKPEFKGLFAGEAPVL
jgi:hypothetical protein